MSHRALVVAPSASAAGRIAGWIAAEGYDARVCSSFQEAKAELDAHPPDLLVTELKLGAFNGLHLVIRAKSQWPDTRTLVVGDASHLLEDEARRFGAEYVSEPLELAPFSLLASNVPVPLPLQQRN